MTILGQIVAHNVQHAGGDPIIYGLSALTGLVLLFGGLYVLVRNLSQ